ncbi:MAG: AAA family ATPase [Candidatus Thermoplasmatota archaeon]|nr:AAA family ATPase [Candidatus Thermoplasmatota archaeon]MBU1940298.1 AAA family ATPase [Candidatus Thermoplasmatota archaeon]
MKVIAFTGMPFSGKSEAVALAQKRGYIIIRMGDFVWGETKRQGKPIDDIHVGNVATQMREKFGKDIWAQKTIERIHTLEPSSIVIIDGIRNPEEVDRFKKDLSHDFILVAIQATTTVRHHRALNRKRMDDGTNLDQIQKRDKREKGWGLDTVIQDADITIINNTDISTFQQKIINFFNQYEKR